MITKTNYKTNFITNLAHNSWHIHPCCLVYPSHNTFRMYPFKIHSSLVYSYNLLGYSKLIVNSPTKRFYVSSSKGKKKILSYYQETR
jgi:hypothetical protein